MPAVTPVKRVEVRVEGDEVRVVVEGAGRGCARGLLVLGALSSY